MTDARTRAFEAFVRIHGRAPTVLARAPGRVNLIGEHTDYNDGFVLPLAIDRDTVVAAGPADDAAIHAVAVDQGDATDSFSLDGIPIGAGWANYVRGVAAGLQREAVSVRAARLVIAGDVPLGSGLSSSAALEMAVGRALLELAGAELDPTILAQVGQWAEHEFAGCACGIMDQLVSARGVAGHALLIDCRSLVCTAVPVLPDTAVIVAHSGVRHSHAEGAYNDRRRQCEDAARHYGVAALRDLSSDRLNADRDGLDAQVYRRARHVVTENARTLAAADALRQGDLHALGALMAASHASMRDDFEITVPAIDRLAAIMAAPLDGEGGARMTGGGFGGCVVAVAPRHRAASVVETVARDYRDPNGRLADVFVCRASDGAGVVPSPAMIR